LSNSSVDEIDSRLLGDGNDLDETKSRSISSMPPPNDDNNYFDDEFSVDDIGVRPHSWSLKVLPERHSASDAP